MIEKLRIWMSSTQQVEKDFEGLEKDYPSEKSDKALAKAKASAHAEDVEFEAEIQEVATRVANSFNGVRVEASSSK